MEAVQSTTASAIGWIDIGTRTKARWGSVGFMKIVEKGN
jgi:hypothetical protein